jgi:MFS family permease
MKFDSKTKTLILLSGLIPEAILESTLIPLYPFMIRHLLPQEVEIGHYAGLLGSAFYLPLFLMNLVWGAASDRIGRKPILLVGILVCFATSLILGFSESYYLTLCCRLVAGFFGANSTVAKGMIGDLARDTRTRAWSYAMYGSVYGLSGFLGPLLGGMLANPAELYPAWFSKDGVFGQHPFLLIFLLAAALSFLGFFITLLFLSETPEEYQEIVVGEEEEEEVVFNSSFDNEVLEGVALRKPNVRSQSPQHVTVDAPVNSPTRRVFQFFTWNTMGPIFLYCTIAYTNMTYMTALPLFFSSKKADGGLGLNSRDTALSFTVIAGTKLFFQFFLFDRTLLWIGSAKKTYKVGMLLYLPGHIFIPFLVYSSGMAGFVCNFIVMACFGTCESLGYLAVILLITESQQPQNLGIAHGLASTLAALARTLAPAICGFVWEWGVTLHWNWLVFFMGGSVALMGVIAAH